MNPILQNILANENELAIKLINESYINLVSCLDTAAALDQRDVVLALLKINYSIWLKYLLKIKGYGVQLLMFLLMEILLLLIRINKNF